MLQSSQIEIVVYYLFLKSSDSSTIDKDPLFQILQSEKQFFSKQRKNVEKCDIILTKDTFFKKKISPESYKNFIYYKNYGKKRQS